MTCAASAGTSGRSSPVNGSECIAVVRLSDADDATLAAPGETCERIPADSLGGLLEAGLIIPAPAQDEE